MAYNKNGNKQYTLKEKINYHTQCVNTKTNVTTGDKLTSAQIIRHGVLAEKCKTKLNKFMQKPEGVRKAIIAESKKNNK